MGQTESAQSHTTLTKAKIDPLKSLIEDCLWGFRIDINLENQQVHLKAELKVHFLLPQHYCLDVCKSRWLWTCASNSFIDIITVSKSTSGTVIDWDNLIVAKNFDNQRGTKMKCNKFFCFVHNVYLLFLVSGYFSFNLQMLLYIFTSFVHFNFVAFHPKNSAQGFFVHGSTVIND